MPEKRRNENRPSSTWKLAKMLTLTAVGTIAVCEMIALLNPQFFYNFAALQNERLRYSQAVDVSNTQTAFHEYNEYKIPEEIDKATLKIGNGTGTLIDLIEDAATNSTYAIFLTANHVREQREINDVMEISNNGQSTVYSSNILMWEQYRDKDFALAVLKIPGIVKPAEITPIDIGHIVPPSVTDIYNNKIISIGFAGVPGPDGTVVPSNSYSVTTISNASFQNDGTLIGSGQIAGGMSGGPSITPDGYIIGVNIDFIWDGESIINPKSATSFIQPVPNDFLIFYDNLRKKFTLKTGVVK